MVSHVAGLLYLVTIILSLLILKQFSGVAGPLAAQGGGQICRPFVLRF